MYKDEKLTSYEFDDVCLRMNIVEQVWCVVIIRGCKYLVGCVYRPGDMVNMIELRKMFETVRSYVGKDGFKDVIIMGDFNFPNIKWSNGGVEKILVRMELNLCFKT